MGMFDYLICEYELPEKIVQHEVFQTKDLDCDLDRYTIGVDGYLYKLEWDDDGSGHPVSVKSERYDFHGDIHFYTHIGEPKTPEDWDSPDIWFEYVARFSYGKLDSIKRV